MLTIREFVFFLAYSIMCTNCFSQMDCRRNDFGVKGEVRAIKSIEYYTIIENEKIKKGESLEGNESMVFNANGLIENKTTSSGYFTYEYDENGNLERYYNYKYDSTLYDRTEIEYKNGRIFKTESYASVGVIISEVVHSYDYLNRLEQRRTKLFNGEGLGDWSISDYTYLGQTEIIHTKLGLDNREHVFIETEDSVLNTISTISIDASTDKYTKNIEKMNDNSDVIFHYSNNNEFVSVKTYEYEYDEFGNWYWRLTIVNDKPFKITERQIEYF